MATKLYLRNIVSSVTDTGDTLCYRLLTTAGSSSDTGVVNTTSGGTNIQWTKTAGGSSMAWISDRVPAGGFTLTSVNVSAWLEESAAQANAKGRFRIYRYIPLTSVTELGGSPFDTAAELGSGGPAEITWTANVTDTAFSENDRILIRFFITNNGTMGASRTCTITFNAADAATGDTFATLAETVALKPAAYTLTCSAGAYALTGIAATLKRARTATLSAGSYTLSGVAASLKKGGYLSLAAGALTLSIADVITVDRGLAMNAGSYSLSGQAATLTYASTGGSPTIALATGSYSLSGQPAGLIFGRKVPLAAGALTLSIADTITVDGGLGLNSGAYTLSGVTANFQKSGTVYSLSLSAGSLSLTGRSVELLDAHKLTLAAGSYTLSGVALNFLAHGALTLNPGSYALSGVSANLGYNRKPSLAAGSYALSGVAAGLRYGYRVTAAAGTYTWNIADTITVDRGLALGAGSYSLSGVAATFTFTPSGNRVLAMGLGSYALSGAAAGLYEGRFLVLGPGSYAWTIANVITVDRGLTQAAGSYTLSGGTLTLPSGRTLPLSGGVYSITGATSVNDDVLVQGAGSYSLSGVSATLKLNHALVLSSGAYALTGVPASPIITQHSVYTLQLGAGSFAVSGVSSVLKPRHDGTVATGIYTLSGQNVGLKTGRLLLVSPGSYALSGQAVAFGRGYTIALAAGSFTLSGVSATFRPLYNFVMDSGSYDISGKQLGLTGSAIGYGNDSAPFIHRRRIIISHMRG